MQNLASHFDRLRVDTGPLLYTVYNTETGAKGASGAVQRSVQG
jgi:hypothetical protein